MVLSILISSACSSEPTGNDLLTTACEVPPAIEMPVGLPSDLPWPEEVSMTKSEVNQQFVSIEGFGQRTVERYFEDVQPDLRAKGFDIINTDFEGFEAELYFAKTDRLAGIVSMREGPCDGYVKVNVIYDPLETAEGREAVRKTRKLSGER